MADNFFTEKIGPLPMWGWLAVVTLTVIAYAFESKKKAASANQSQNAANNAAQQALATQAAAVTTVPYTTATTYGGSSSGGYGNGYSGGARMSRNWNPSTTTTTTASSAGSTTASSGTTPVSTPASPVVSSSGGGGVTNPYNGQAFPSATSLGQTFTDSLGNLWTVTNNEGVNGPAGTPGNFAMWSLTSGPNFSFYGNKPNVNLPSGTSLSVPTGGGYPNYPGNTYTTDTTETAFDTAYNANLNSPLNRAASATGQNQH